VAVHGAASAEYKPRFLVSMLSLPAIILLLKLSMI
jgi:hypothetical protein